MLRKTVQQVSLVEDHYQLLGSQVHPRYDITELRQKLIAGSANVEHGDNAVGKHKLLESPSDAYALNLVGSLADAGRIDQPERSPVDVEHFLHRIARRPGDRGDYGPFLTQQGIQQCALPGIGRAHDRYGHSAPDGIAEPERICQFLAMGNGRIQQFQQLPSIGKFYLLLAEIQLKFHQGSNIQKLRPKLL